MTPERQGSSWNQNFKEVRRDRLQRRISCWQVKTFNSVQEERSRAQTGKVTDKWYMRIQDVVFCVMDSFLCLCG